MSEDSYYEEREHRCEHLVRIIQSREGTPSKEDREGAFEELLEMFRPLIKSIASRVYRGYRHKLYTDFSSFYHDTITTAIELVLADYVPKKYGGKAMFAPYLQTKLYYRTLYRAQRGVLQNQREFSSPLQFEGNDRADPSMISNTVLFRDVYEETIVGQINAAILSQVMNTKETVFDAFTQLQIANKIDKLRKIAKLALTDKEHFIWHSTLFSGMQLNEIATSLNASLDQDESAWTKQRVFNAYNKIRIKVLSAFGEASLSCDV
jgi:hypothetical protein